MDTVRVLRIVFAGRQNSTEEISGGAAGKAAAQPVGMAPDGHSFPDPQQHQRGGDATCRGEGQERFHAAGNSDEGGQCRKRDQHGSRVLVGIPRVNEQVVPVLLALLSLSFFERLPWWLTVGIVVLLLPVLFYLNLSARRSMRG